jgi:hypothetical protein
MRQLFLFITSRNLFLLFISIFCIYFSKIKIINNFLEKQVRRAISSGNIDLPTGYEDLIIKHSNDNAGFIGYLSGIITIFFSGLLLLKNNSHFEIFIFLVAILYLILVIVIVTIFIIKSSGNLLSSKIGRGKLRRFSYSTIIDRSLDFCNSLILLILILIS